MELKFCTGPAKRLNQLVLALHAVQGIPPMSAYQAWYSVLQLHHEASQGLSYPQLEETLYPFFEDIRLDIGALRIQLEERNVPEHLYANALNSFVALATGQHFHSDWASLHRGTLTAELCLAFAWCAFLLPDGEAAANESDITSIATTLDELEASLADADLPPNLARFLRKLVTRMRQATRRYYTSGARAFVAAQADVVKEVMSNPGLQKEAEVAAHNPATKSLLTKSFDMLKAASEVAGAIDKTGAGVAKIKQLGETISNWLS